MICRLVITVFADSQALASGADTDITFSYHLRDFSVSVLSCISLKQRPYRHIRGLIPQGGNCLMLLRMYKIWLPANFGFSIRDFLSSYPKSLYLKSRSFFRENTASAASYANAFDRCENGKLLVMIIGPC